MGGSKGLFNASYRVSYSSSLSPSAASEEILVSLYEETMNTMVL